MNEKKQKKELIARLVKLNWRHHYEMLFAFMGATVDHACDEGCEDCREMAQRIRTALDISWNCMLERREPTELSRIVIREALEHCLNSESISVGFLESVVDNSNEVLH